MLYADDALRKKVEEQLKPIEEAVERGSLMDLARPKRTQSWEKYIHHGTRKQCGRISKVITARHRAELKDAWDALIHRIWRPSTGSAERMRYVRQSPVHRIRESIAQRWRRFLQKEDAKDELAGVAPPVRLTNKRRKTTHEQAA